MKEFELTFKIRNNLLIQRREEMRLSRGECAKAIGIHYVDYCRYEAMSRSPVTSKNVKDSFWTPTALRIAKFFGVDPEELFPPSVRQVRKNKAVKKVDFVELVPLLPEHEEMAVLAEYNPTEDVIDLSKLKNKTQEILRTLTPREQRILEMRFGINEKNKEYSLEEIGEDFEVTRSRIMQIEAKALRKLRHPSRAQRLRPFADGKVYVINCAASGCSETTSSSASPGWLHFTVSNVLYDVCSYACRQKVIEEAEFITCDAPGCESVDYTQGYQYTKVWVHPTIEGQKYHACSSTCFKLIRSIAYVNKARRDSK
jgi:RNA polymerase sigma factor (sigma-70 family)